MTKKGAMIVAMADKCKDLILASEATSSLQAPSLSPRHLAWMCTEVALHAGDWHDTKLHRWIGFVQGAMIANRIIRLPEAKTMFDSAKNDYQISDPDLLDHLDADSAFELDLGGQG